MSALFDRGNVVRIPTETLTKYEVTVSWTQMLRSRSEQYYAAPCYNENKGLEESFIFIQKNMIDQLKSKTLVTGDVTVAIDDSFQYGEDQEKTSRWLVFHDKANKPYQSRFVEDTYAAIGNIAFGFLSKNTIRPDGFKVEHEVFKRSYGSYLRDFSAR